MDLLPTITNRSQPLPQFSKSSASLVAVALAKALAIRLECDLLGGRSMVIQEFP